MAPACGARGRRRASPAAGLLGRCAVCGTVAALSRPARGQVAPASAVWVLAPPAFRAHSWLAHRPIAQEARVREPHGQGRALEFRSGWRPWQRVVNPDWLIWAAVATPTDSARTPASTPRVLPAPRIECLAFSFGFTKGQALAGLLIASPPARGARVAGRSSTHLIARGTRHTSRVVLVLTGSRCDARRAGYGRPAAARRLGPRQRLKPRTGWAARLKH